MSHLNLGRTALYRMFTASGELLYAGISNNFGRRWEEHAAHKPWWAETQRMTIDWYPTQQEAEAQEAAAIEAEQPTFNVAHPAFHVRKQRESWQRSPESDARWADLASSLLDEPERARYRARCGLEPTAAT